MQAYILRRLLLMIPTFFGIALVIFVVLNLAPGRPGVQSSDVATDAKGEATQESYKIFREQFNLDKPTLLNTRFALTTAEVQERLRVVATLAPASVADRIAAQEQLEDWGNYSVPALIDVLNSASEPALRDTAAYFLRLSAPRRLINPHNPSDEERVANTKIDQENAALRDLRYAFDAPEAEKQRVVDSWNTWFQGVGARYQFTFSDKVKILFVDTRFASYLSNLFRLDFGVSLVTREPVIETLISKLPYSLTLSVGSLILAYLIAIPIGIFSAVRKDSAADRATTTVLFMLYSLPSFFVATLLIIFLSQGSTIPWLRWFPTGGWQSPDADQMPWLDRMLDIGWHIVLPLLCMTYASLAALSRYMRSGLLEVIQSDYVRTARAKGLSEVSVIGKHALRNGLLPILTLLAGLLPAVLGGSVIIEYIFGIPGMGQWMVDSIYQRDYNVIMAIQLLTTALVLVGMLITDLSYALVDPRIRYT